LAREVLTRHPYSINKMKGSQLYNFSTCLLSHSFKFPTLTTSKRPGSNTLNLCLIRFKFPTLTTSKRPRSNTFNLCLIHFKFPTLTTSKQPGSNTLNLCLIRFKFPTLTTSKRPRSNTLNLQSIVSHIHHISSKHDIHNNIQNLYHI